MFRGVRRGVQRGALLPLQFFFFFYLLDPVALRPLEAVIRSESHKPTSLSLSVIWAGEVKSRSRSPPPIFSGSALLYGRLPQLFLRARRTDGPPRGGAL